MRFQLYLCLVLLRIGGASADDEDVLKKLLLNLQNGYNEEVSRTAPRANVDETAALLPPLVLDTKTQGEPAPSSTGSSEVMQPDMAPSSRDFSLTPQTDTGPSSRGASFSSQSDTASTSRDAGLTSQADTVPSSHGASLASQIDTASTSRESSAPVQKQTLLDEMVPSSRQSSDSIQPDKASSNIQSNTRIQDSAPSSPSNVISRGIFKVQKHALKPRDHDPATAQWFGQTGRDFHGWRDELNFPGSGYVLTLIDAHLTEGRYLTTALRDPFRANATIISAIASDLVNVTSVLTDPDVLALIYTRRMTYYIQQERMLCAAAKFDMVSMKAMMTEINGLFADDDDAMEDFLLTLLDDLPSVPDQQWTTQTLATDLSLRIHDMIFNDTIHYLLGRSYRDVTMFSRGLYKSLQKFFRSQYVTRDTFVAIVTDMLIYDSNVHCPTDLELKVYRRDAMWDLTSSLEDIETTELCMGMRSFIESNFFTVGGSKMTSDYDKTMVDMCDYVKTYVSHLYLNVKEYERMLMQRDPDGLKTLFQKYLTTDGLMTLVSVLESLKWAPSLTIIDNVGPTKINATLPAAHVIQHVKNDISYWQSFLTQLTPEAFTRIDLSQFKQTIQEWLDKKQKQVSDYTAKLRPTNA